jgi:alkylhydroperoxidase/carboxymuconolactone decarboxylase family protein YurZ
LSSLNRIFARKKGKIMHIKTFVTAVMLCMAGCMHAQQTSTINHKEKNMEKENTWTAFVAIAAQEAKGNIEALKKAIDEGFEQGLTVSKIKEALSQLYAYTGFPRSLNALGALQQVVKERQEKGLATPAGKEADAMAPDYDALKQGTEVQTRLTGVPFNYEFAPQTDYYLKAHLFGDIFARNNLTHAEREIVTVSAIAALPGCEPQLKAHATWGSPMHSCVPYQHYWQRRWERKRPSGAPKPSTRCAAPPYPCPPTASSAPYGPKAT